MIFINLGNGFKAFPNNQVLAHLENGDEVYPTWGYANNITKNSTKVFCNKITIKEYKNWIPVVIMSSIGFYGGIISPTGTSVLIYSESNHNSVTFHSAKLFDNPESFFKLFNSIRK